MRSAPKVSPDASPATMPTRKARGTDMVEGMDADEGSATLKLLSNDAAFAALDELDEGPDLRLALGGFLEFLHRSLQFESGAIQHAEGAANVEDLCRAEAAALQAHGVDAVRRRRPPDRHDIRRHITGHRGVVRN